MYSVVLMAALTTGGAAPDCWPHHGHGHGGSGYVSNTCTGCYGGSYFGAGYGPCAGGSGGYGCYGGTWGYGGGWGGSGIDYNCFGCHGCYGCYGGFGCAGYAPGGAGGMAPEQIPPPKVEDKKSGTSMIAPDRAKVVVQLPSDAKLYVDDQPIKAAAERQTFSTPRLERGQTYFYDVRAEVVRDGKTVVETKRVLVRAGEEVTVSFPKIAPANADVAAADPARRR